MTRGAARAQLARRGHRDTSSLDSRAGAQLLNDVVEANDQFNQQGDGGEEAGAPRRRGVPRGQLPETRILRRDVLNWNIIVCCISTYTCAAIYI